MSTIFTLKQYDELNNIPINYYHPNTDQVEDDYKARTTVAAVETKTKSSNNYFEENTQYLINSMIFPANKGISYQPISMDSDAFNDTMNTIEYRLNSIYEKFRMLQEILEYSKEFVEGNVYDLLKESRSLYANLIAKKDSFNFKGYVDYEMPFIEGTGSYTDRDGVVIPHTSVNAGQITISGETINTIKYDSITKSSSYIAASGDINALKSGLIYRSSYSLKDAPAAGVIETVKLSFNNPVSMNYIDVITSRCDVIQVNYIYENGSSESSTDFVEDMMKERRVKAIELILAATSYDKESYTVVSEYDEVTNWGVRG